ncbi:diguanylate cyclase (GGDEF)-like protein [Paenibacillus castaneae]|uniref:GGDEF domain-containing protein n=1 Tax=Paenibacillus castaneae TaxID=474957 RepID=UPI000C9A434D|nr:GGDEF domain-containing protein [Paenibacillus castaneae]NIK77811.1 diguanylate cyclase (GGDEF)-like protein [Paenibacillus castaneae]
MPTNNEIAKRSKRYTIGLLSEVAHYESESLLFQGMINAAEIHDANVIYFTPVIDDGEELRHASLDEETNQHIRRKHDKLKAHTASYDLDALVIIGWSNDFIGENGRYLQDILYPVRLISIGKSSEHFPSVIMNGGQYVKDMVRHLVTDHGYRSIAFVPTWSDDDRAGAYANELHEHGLFDKSLLINVHELADYTQIDQRMNKALSLLLDERGLQVDAIMLTNAFEGKYMLDELTSRGLRVPEDIALVCFENHSVIEFSKPSLTTIYFPFKEIGYSACENLIKLLDGEDIPHIMEVPGKIINRDSCGCTVNKIKPMLLDSPLASIEKTAVAINDACSFIAQQMSQSFAMKPFDYAKLASLFVQSAETADSQFLSALVYEMEQVRAYDVNQLQAMIDLFRKLLLPYVSHDRIVYERAEMLWFSARYIMKDYDYFSVLTRFLGSHEDSRILSSISQSILSARSIPQVTDALINNLGWIQIPTTYIFLNDSSHSKAEQSRLVFAFDEYQTLIDDYSPESGIVEAFQLFKQKKNNRFNLIVHPLRVNDKELGIAWADPGKHNAHLIVTLGDQISIALESNRVLEESHELVTQLSREIILRQEKEAQLTYFADIDSLTHLFNRRFFYNSLSSIARHDNSFTLFYIDIDGFKQVNDTLGHDAGDTLLNQIADRLRNVLSDQSFLLSHTMPGVGMTKSNAIFRLGGDEFTVLLQTADSDVAAAYASKAVEAIRQPYVLTGGTAIVSSSIGIAMYPADTDDSDLLIKYADLALYKAKEVKDTFVFYRQLVE